MAVGLPAALAAKIFSSTFYANHDTKTPVRIAITSVVVNLALNLALMIPMQYVGLALSTSIASWANALQLAHALKKRRMFVTDATLRFRLIRIVIASLLMGLVLWALAGLLAGYFHMGLFVKIVGLGVLIGAGMLGYGLALRSLRVMNMSQLREYFVRKR
jgi:putative peptidoglycan lipid II flippase